MDQTTTDYIWDVAAGLPVVLQDGTNTYVYGLDLIAATDGAGDETYFTYDGLGSTADLTDGSGNVVDGYTYDVFGAIRSQSGSSDNYWLFTGEQSESDEGLYYLRARYYDPATGRFLGRDPFLGFWSSPTSLNRYVYALDNPTTFIDPYGLFGFKDIKKAAGGTVDKVAKVAKTVAKKTGAAAVTISSGIADAASDAIDYLATCDWKKIGAGAAILGGAAVAGGLGGYVFVTGYGTATGATTLAGAAHGGHLMIEGGVIGGLGGGSLGLVSVVTFSQADCGHPKAPSGPQVGYQPTHYPKE